MQARLLKYQQENNTKWEVFNQITKIYSRQQSSRLKGAKRSSVGGDQSLKLSTKAAVFQRINFSIEGPSMSIEVPDSPWPPLARALPRFLFLSRMDWGGYGPRASPRLRLCLQYSLFLW